MFTGPYLITHCFSPVNVVLQLNQRRSPFVSHVDKLKLCLGPTPASWLTDQNGLEEGQEVRNDGIVSRSPVVELNPEPEVDFAPVMDEQLEPVLRRGGRTIRPPRRFDC